MEDQIDALFVEMDQLELDVGDPFEYESGGHKTVVMPFYFKGAKYVMYFQAVTEAEKELFLDQFNHQMADNAVSIKFGQARWFCQDNFVSRDTDGLNIDLGQGGVFRLPSTLVAVVKKHLTYYSVDEYHFFPAEEKLNSLYKRFADRAATELQFKRIPIDLEETEGYWYGYYNDTAAAETDESCRDERTLYRSASSDC